MRNQLHCRSLFLRLAAALALCSGLLTASPLQPAHAGTWTVTSTADSGAGTLRQAILDASAGDTITFDSTMAAQTITLASTLTIDKSLILDATAAPATVSGNNAVRVFSINSGSDVMMKGLTITKGILAGANESGAGIYNAGTLSLENCHISDNVNNSFGTNYGGGIYTNGTLSVTNTSFTGNSALGFQNNGIGGGIYSAGGSVLVTNSTFSSNSAYAGGGGIYSSSGSLVVTNSNFLSNMAYGSGAGIYSAGSSTTVSGSTFSNNFSITSSGAGIYVSAGSLTVSSGTFSNNMVSNGSGAGIYAAGSSLTLRDSQFSQNMTYSGNGGGMVVNSDATINNTNFSNNMTNSGNGGGIYIGAGSTSVTGGTFSQNGASSGAGIYAGGSSLSVDGSMLKDNIVSGQGAGGGINAGGGNLTVNQSSFTGNFGGARGGGIATYANTTITDSTFSTNAASLGGAVAVNAVTTITNSTFSGNGANSGGGGIAVDANTSVTGSTFSGNQVNLGDGGGIYAVSGSTVIGNSSFSGNVVMSNGGGIFAGNTSRVTIANSTLSGNQSGLGNGAGVYNAAQLSMENTLIANSIFTNTPRQECYSSNALTSNTNNLVEDGSCSSGATNFHSGDPSLASLADNGGPTQTMALQTGSTAINAGDTTACNSSPINAKDQRGVIRPADACDIGAYESTDDATPPTVSVNQAAAQPDPTKDSPIHFTAIFSEPIKLTSLTAADLTLSSSGAGTLSAAITQTAPNDSTTFDIAVSGMTGNGAVTITIDAGKVEDWAGNLNTASTSTDNSVTYDVTGPTLTVDQASSQADPTHTSPIHFTAVFSIAIDPATFTGSDVTLGGTAPGTKTAAVTQIAPNDGTSFDIAVSGMSDSGTVTADIDAGKVKDVLGFDNAASSSTDNSVTYDVTSPGVTVNQAASQADPTHASPVHFTAVFSKPIDVDTFTSSDVTLGGSAPGTLSATITQTPPNDGTTFDIAVSGMSDSGTVNATIAAGTVKDTPGNDNTASSSTDNLITYDVTALTVQSIDLRAQYVGSSPRQFVVRFSEAVYDPAGNSDPDDVTNPANFLLVERGRNKTFDTRSCSGKVKPDDRQIIPTSISYDSASFTAQVRLPGALAAGAYRLFICGTTSILDAALNPLNGGADFQYDFTVIPYAVELPNTGFAPGQVTHLAVQPAGKAYADTDMTLSIPTLDVSAPITGVPAKEDGWDISWLGNSAGYLAGSAYPTWAGNTVLTGHVWNANNTPGIFADLKHLRYGDEIRILAHGKVFTYAVRENALLSTGSVAEAFHSEEHAWVTLLTCESYDLSSGAYRFRRMVQAVLVRVE